MIALNLNTTLVTVTTSLSATKKLNSYNSASTKSYLHRQRYSEPKFTVTKVFSVPTKSAITATHRSKDRKTQDKDRRTCFRTTISWPTPPQTAGSRYAVAVHDVPAGLACCTEIPPHHMGKTTARIVTHLNSVAHTLPGQRIIKQVRKWSGTGQGQGWTFISHSKRLNTRRN